jgi:ABC-2 type transport system permease protein
MITRVGRLLQVELLKLCAQPFIFVALVLIALGTVGAEWVFTLLKGQKASSWGALHAIQLFSYGWGFGLKLATIVLVIASSMLIAGEFDRGTIKVLLTRPVTRTEFYLAKVFTVLLLGVFLFAFVLFVSLACAFAVGTLGPVWDETAYLVQREADEINGHAIRAVGITALSFLAAGFLGLMVSTWTESSGYAVAISLVLFLFGDILTSLAGSRVQENLFFHYGPYAVDKLKELAQGGTTRWSPRVVERSSHVTVPLVYIAAFVPAAYGLFRSKNITA